MSRQLSALCFVFCLAACKSAAPGKDTEDLRLYSDAAMVSRGEAAYREILRSERLSGETSKNQLALCVTQRLVEAMTDEERGNLRWEVNVFAKDTANAFALPGGKIGVYAGLFDYARTEHQLAAVLAHEVGHVFANHSNERASRDTLVSAGKVLGTLAGIPQGTLQMLDIAGQFGLLMPFGRAQESEADAFGLMLMARAGFDPEESVLLWQNMDDDRIPGFLSTHPTHETRIENLQSLMGPARVLYEAAFAQDRVATCRNTSFFN